MAKERNTIFGADGEYKENCNLKIVHIPSTYTSIAEEAFIDSNIEELSIPQSVTEIGDGAFVCAKIKRLILPDWKYWCGINLLGEWSNPLVTSEHVFIGDEEISTSINIPDKVRELKPGVLCGLSKVEHIHLPNTINAIGEGAFSGCESLKEINIPESVTTIGEKAFMWCNLLTKVVIPRSVRCISRWAFSNCNGLASVVLTAGLRQIEYGAFYACYNLRSVISLNTCPPDSEDAFDYKGITLYVPAGSVEAYAKAEGWKKFENIKEIDPNDADYSQDPCRANHNKLQ
jgi:hypothetical protein